VDCPRAARTLRDSCRRAPRLGDPIVPDVHELVLPADRSAGRQLRSDLGGARSARLLCLAGRAADGAAGLASRKLRLGGGCYADGPSWTGAGGVWYSLSRLVPPWSRLAFSSRII
jgi:hypothetical protein